LILRTRLNDQVVQQASTADMVFDIASLVSILSEAFTLQAGDVIVSGTPSGVGLARTPPLFMRCVRWKSTDFSPCATPSWMRIR